VRKSKRKAIVIRTVKPFFLSDSSYIRYSYNAVVILKKRLTPEGKEVFGPISRNLKIKKFLPSFSGLI
jgi:large subunit ribosomal protein L14